MNRLQRRFTGGFLATVLLSVVLATLALATGSRLESNHDQVAVLQAQRADLLEVQIRLAALALETDDAIAAEERLELGRVVERVRARQVDLLVAAPDLAAAMVTDADGSMIAFGTGMATALDEIDEAVVVITTSGWNPALIDVAVEEATTAADAVTDVLTERAERSGGVVVRTARTIERVGLVLAGIFLATGIARIFVLGRPLIRTMRRDQLAFAEARDRHEEEGMRRELTARLTEGLETVETEEAVLAVVERTLEQIVVDHPTELLLSDSSKAHLHAVAVNPRHDAPACGVTSPWSCPAVRRGTAVSYADSRSLRACPYLADRGELAATCVPVSFMGDAMGVLHVTGEVGWSPSELTVDSLEIVAGQAAVRLGSLRSFLKAELQANTDVLTGLPNRRATEHHVREQLAEHEQGSLALADLDRFKHLNDSHGHEAGDRALRLFAEVLRDSTRDQDFAGRWGGEEFVLFLPGLASIDAADALNRIRQNLANACRRFDGPDFTVSIGVVDTAVGSTIDHLVSLADDALYAAKQAGRDRVLVGPVTSGDRALDAEVVS